MENKIVAPPAVVGAKPVYIGKYCTYEQATFSATAKKLGLANVPTPADIARMVYTHDTIIVPVFDHFGPGDINSFFRSGVLQRIPGTKRYTSVNAAVGGSPTSNHIRGMAVDMDYDKVKGVTNIMVFDWIRLNIPFYELISEVPEPISQNPQWVHAAGNEENPDRKLVKRMIYGSEGQKIYQVWPWEWAKLKK